MKKTSLFLLLFCFGFSLYAKVPYLINYQGKLRQSGALANGDKNMVFRIYDSLSAGTLIWQSQIQVVHVTNGIFNTYIGLTSNGTQFSNIIWDSYAATYLETEVQPGGPLVPRSQLMSSPYSLLALSVAQNGTTTNSIQKGFGLVPAGTIMMWPTEIVPNGWLECNGASISKATYPELYLALKNGGATCIYGESGGNFNLPDMRGLFIRGWDHSANNDPDVLTRTNKAASPIVTGDHVGTRQDDAGQGHHHSDSGHTHLTTYGSSGADYVPYLLVGGMGHGAGNTSSDSPTQTGYANLGPQTTYGGYGSPRISTETRSKNINMMFIIKY